MEPKKPKQLEKAITVRNKMAFYPSDELRAKIILLTQEKGESQSRVLSWLVYTGLKNI
jgi:hypothetical protein